MKDKTILIIPGLIVGGLSAIGWADLFPLWAAIPIGFLFVFWLAFFSVRFATTRSWPCLLLALLALLPCAALDGFGVKSLLTFSDSTGLSQSITAETTALADRNEYDFALSRHESNQREIENLTAEIARARQIQTEIQAEQRIIDAMDSDGLRNDHLIPGLQAQLDARRAAAVTTADIAGKQAILDTRLATAADLKGEIERLRQTATQTAREAHKTAQSEHLVLSLASLAGQRIDATQADTWSAAVLTAGGAIVGAIAELLYMFGCIIVSWIPRQKIRLPIPETQPDPDPEKSAPLPPEKPAEETAAPAGKIIAPQFTQPPRGVTPSRNEDWQPVGIHSFPPDDTQRVTMELDTPEKIDYHFRRMNRARELPRFYRKEEISEMSTEAKLNMIVLTIRAISHTPQRKKHAAA